MTSLYIWRSVSQPCLSLCNVEVELAPENTGGLNEARVPIESILSAACGLQAPVRAQTADGSCATCPRASSTRQLGAGPKARKVVVHSNQKGSSYKNFYSCYCSFNKKRCVQKKEGGQFYLGHTILRYIQNFVSFLHSVSFPTSLPPISSCSHTQPPLDQFSLLPVMMLSALESSRKS